MKAAQRGTSLLTRILHHPLSRGMEPDDPRATIIRRKIVAHKGFLRRLYREWYELLAAAVPPGAGAVLELGTGAGFLNEFIPELITSDVLALSGLSLVCDGQRMPFRDGSLKAILLVDVLHHLPRVREFFREATRCVRPGGAMLMIEPWVTSWSRFVYGHLHHEPFLPDAKDWEFPPSGPLSGANEALPWIVFHRDAERFRQEFPFWSVTNIRLFMPFSYLLSGGVSLRALAPGWAYHGIRRVERLLDPWLDWLALFALIVMERGHERPQSAGNAILASPP